MATLVLLAWLVSLSCGNDTTGPQEGVDQPDPIPTPQNPVDGFVSVSPGVRLHYLDFGGSGPDVLLLAGLGNTANAYRSFAPLLTDHFRVRALTRRGYGRSSQPADGYDRPTLARDILTLLDTLGISVVHLVGHSIAGDEMTRFAIQYGGRLGKLAYLDAAYDRTVASVTPAPGWQTPPPPTVADLASRSSYQAYLGAVLGVTFPIEEVVAGTHVGSDGAVTGLVTPPSVQAAMTANAEPPAYDSVLAPAIGIYAMATSPTDVFPWLSPSSADWPDAEAWLNTELLPRQAEERARFADETPVSSLVEISGAKHYIYLSHPTRTASEVITFLGGT